MTQSSTMKRPKQTQKQNFTMMSTTESLFLETPTESCVPHVYFSSYFSLSLYPYKEQTYLSRSPSPTSRVLYLSTSSISLQIVLV